MMNLKNMYGSTPERFQSRVRYALAQAERNAASAHRPVWRTVVLTALVMALVLGVAAAALHSQVAEYFGQFYGGRLRDELLAGNIAQEMHSTRIGDVIYTLEEVIYIDNGLYGVGRITPAEETIVLMAEDYQVTDAAGYGLYYGEDSRAPEGAPTYADRAREKNGKILIVSTVPEAVGVDGGTVLPLATAGYSLYPQMDGSIVFAFEIPTGVAVEDGQEYLIRLWSSNWEVTQDGQWLRDETNDTYLGETWDAVVTPERAQEEER